MIDISHQLFTRVAGAIRDRFPEARVLGEYQRTPARFPCVTVEEISSLPAGLDSGPEEPRSLLVYRVQVFAANETGGRRKAREMMALAAGVFGRLNFTRKSCATQNELYRSDFYTMSATFEAEVDENGVLYRTR